jgi:NAD(P)-dependent dehydrogenase (short-subunit alcohol dehydrogenase family)
MNDHVVLITGAANGLGRALTLLFMSKGWKVIATDIDEPGMTELKKEKNTLVMRMDVTSDKSVETAYETVKNGKLDIDMIINNAGIDRYFPFSEAPVERIREVFDVNLFGGYRVNQTFLPLVRRPGGRIIHVSSESLHLNAPFMPYPLSKMAVEGYAKVLRQELRFAGIDVVIIRPGAIRTALLDNVINLKSTADGQGLSAEMKRFGENAPKKIGKVLEPEGVAEFIYKVSQKQNPKAVYKINNSLQLKIAAILPFSLVEKLIARQLNG